MLDIIKAHAVKNLCYITARKMTPGGIGVHSTGANNPYLKRYVDCSEELGINAYGNHWNTAKPGGRKVCVHAFIGYDKDKNIRVAEILPLDICCWGIGSGSKGSYNYDPPHIQFEICEDGLKDETYYRKVFGVAAEYCAYLCKKFDLTPDQIVGHNEAHKRGYGSNHADPEHWMEKFGETMDDFRDRVADLLKESDAEVETKQESADEETVAPKVISKGDLVSIADNATYYSGKNVPNWVKTQNWYVKGDPKGYRVVIDKNEKGTNSICSPISAKYLTVVKAAAQTEENEKPESGCPYLVKVTASSLNIRKGAGTNTAKVGCITDKGVYTIVEERDGTGTSKWGKLKSGAGWISLAYVKKL